MATFLQRNERGEYEAVWHELVALGAAVRVEPLYADAWAVACETMRRVRHNIELLVSRLEARGYQFGHTWLPIDQRRNHPQIFTPPALDVQNTIANFERRVGALPLSLRAFYEKVGSVNFVGTPPATWSDWRRLQGDPDALYLYAAADALEDAELWMERYGDLTEEDWGLSTADNADTDYEDLCDTRAYFALPQDCWIVPIALDEWLKYNVSGCGSYDIAVPNLAADARLLTESHRTSFVQYLRICFKWAGFPKLEQIASVPPR